MTNLNENLISYGTWLLGIRLGQSFQEPPKHPVLGAVLSLIGDKEPTSATEQLASVFSWLEGAGDAPWIRFGVLGRFGLIEQRDASAAWGKFHEIAQSLTPGDLDSFLHAYSKFGATISTYRRGISLYEWFKFIAAVCVCYERAKDGNLLLIAGDLPGIQQMLYTITSAGAGRSLRGRSFYLQLLSEALLHTLLRRLQLPEACVVYNAGGNFKMLAPGSKEDCEKVAQTSAWLNERLSILHGGELFAAIASEPLRVSELRGNGFAQHVQAVSAALEREKRRWFATFASKSMGNFVEVFQPHEEGGLKPRCTVCHVEVNGKDQKCDQCQSFEDLANDLRDPHFLTINSSDTAEIKRNWNGKPTWARVLQELGFKYEMVEKQPSGASEEVYTLNSGELPSVGNKRGARYLACVTPLVRSGDDLEALRKHLLEDERASLEVGSIRSTTLMAEADATGIARWGVLRMDVDGLGALFQRGWDMPQTSALSAALSRFFEGQLNEMCRNASSEWARVLGKLIDDQEAKKSKLPYVIYAGGDDLFIIGCWDVLPILAWHIHHAFARETGGRLTVSGGIAVFPSKFPLYQAAEIAGTAEAAAKAWARGEARKNAVTFLGQTLPWAAFIGGDLETHGEWTSAWGITRWLVEMIRAEDVSHGFLNALGGIAELYRKDARKHPEDNVPRGRWSWRLAYYLARAAETAEKKGKKEVADQIREFGKSVTTTGSHGLAPMEYLGLAVRWAEYLIRGKEG